MRNRPHGTPKGRPSFEEACRMYVHRYTAQHVPLWAGSCPADHGGTERRFYAPRFASDREWYDNTVFPGEPEHQVYGFSGFIDSCVTTGQTWPYGQWLDEPYNKDNRPHQAPAGPAIDVTWSEPGSDATTTIRGLKAAADHVANLIQHIDESEVGTVFRVEVEIMGAGGE